MLNFISNFTISIGIAVSSVLFLLAFVYEKILKKTDKEYKIALWIGLLGLLTAAFLYSV